MEGLRERRPQNIPRTVDRDCIPSSDIYRSSFGICWSYIFLPVTLFQRTISEKSFHIISDDAFTGI